MPLANVLDNDDPPRFDFFAPRRLKGFHALVTPTTSPLLNARRTSAVPYTHRPPEPADRWQP
jgi:hypothetical protein